MNKWLVSTVNNWGGVGVCESSCNTEGNKLVGVTLGLTLVKIGIWAASDSTMTWNVKKYVNSVK